PVDAEAPQEVTRLPPVVASDALLVQPNKSPSLVPPVLALRSDAPGRPGALARLPRRALVVGTTVAAASLVLIVGGVIALRSHRASASVASASSGSPLASALSQAPAPPPGAPAGSSTETPPDDSRPAPAADAPPAAKPDAPFTAAAARHALDAKK